MKLRERDMPLDPEVERELQAIDHALAGRRVDPDLEELALLAAELRAERPEPGAEAAELLDELAANRFPPRDSDRLGRTSRRVSDALGDLRRKSARRLIPAFGAVAVFVIALGVGISESGVFGGDQTAGPPSGAETASGDAKIQPAPGETATPPGVAATPQASGPALKLRNQSRADGTDALTPALPPSHRKVARNVDLELSTAPDHFRDAADGVLDVVRAHRGFVVSSHVSGGDPGVRGAQRGDATFELRIPAGELSGAMGDLSNLGHVVSRTDGTLDITKRFVSARKRIDALAASRDKLLRRLGNAATVTEQQSIRARLRIVEARLSAAHRDLAKAQQLVHLVPVSVAIRADAHASPGGAWTIGDAFHDAGRILTVGAGVALVAGAALLPFALLAALGVAGWRGWVHRQRRRALDGAPG